MNGSPRLLPSEADAEGSWPAALRLDGFVYDAIRATPEVTVEQCLDWLARDPDGYSPQKYEQLAAVYPGWVLTAAVAAAVTGLLKTDSKPA